MSLIKLEIKKLRRFMANKLNRKLIIVMVLFLIAAGGTYRSLDRRMEKILVEQTLRRERVMGRTGAKSITSFFDLLSHSLALLGKDLDLGNFQQNLDAFIKEWESTPIKGVVWVNELGVRQGSATTGGFEPIEEGVKVGERDFFKKAKNGREGKVYIGKSMLPPGMKESVLIVPVATPVFRNSQFKGALIAAVVIADLTKEYLEPLQLSKETRVYLVRQDGVFLYASTEQLIGANYFDGLKAIDFPGREETEWKLRQALESGEAGDLDIELPDQAEGGVIKRFLASYTPVRMPEADGYYWLAIALPVEKATDLYGPFVTELGVGILLMVLLGFGLAALVLLAWRVIQKEAFEDGFKEGKRHGRKKKK